MSMIPLGGLKPSPNPWLAEHYPASLLTMGLTAERVARHYEISREDQDAFALASHQKALAAQAAGRFDEELVPVKVDKLRCRAAEGGTSRLCRDGVCGRRRAAGGHFGRALAKLKPVFHAQGTVTAGNSSQTSDGAAAAVADGGRTGAGAWGFSRWRGWWRTAVTGCLPEEMGIGPDLRPFPRR